MHHSLIPYRATEPGSPIDGAIDTSADLEVSKSAVAIAAIAAGTATEDVMDRYSRAAIWGTAIVGDAAMPREREVERVLASFAIGAAAMSCRDKCGGGHAVNTSATSHRRNLAAFSYHNLPALEAPPVSGKAAEIFLTTADAGTDADKPKVAEEALVDVLKTAWLARRAAVAESTSRRQKALEASNTFWEEESVSPRMIPSAILEQYHSKCAMSRMPGAGVPAAGR